MGYLTIAGIKMLNNLKMMKKWWSELKTILTKHFWRLLNADDDYYDGDNADDDYDDDFDDKDGVAPSVDDEDCKSWNVQPKFCDFWSPPAATIYLERKRIFCRQKKASRLLASLNSISIFASNSFFGVVTI